MSTATAPNPQLTPQRLLDVGWAKNQALGASIVPGAGGAVSTDPLYLCGVNNLMAFVDSTAGGTLSYTHQNVGTPGWGATVGVLGAGAQLVSFGHGGFNDAVGFSLHFGDVFHVLVISFLNAGVGVLNAFQLWVCGRP